MRYMRTGGRTGSRGRLWGLCPDNQQLAELNQGRRRGLLCAIGGLVEEIFGRDANMVHRRFAAYDLSNKQRAQHLQSGGAITLQDNYQYWYLYGGGPTHIACSI